MFKKCHITILHFSREMTRFIGDVCLVMSIVKVHWCKLPVSNYYNFIEFFYPNFFLDWLSCELSEQNCLNCHNFFSGCYEQFVLVFVYIFFFVLLLFYTVISSQALYRCFPVSQATFEKDSSYNFVLPATLYSSFDSAFGWLFIETLPFNNK